MLVLATGRISTTDVRLVWHLTHLLGIMGQIRRTRERFFSAHHILLLAASRAIEAAEAANSPDDDDLIVAFTMSALSVEAFMNAVGDLLFEDWREFETAPTRAKIFLIARELGLPIDGSRPPWQLIFELGRFRNEIVHAKPERILTSDYVSAGHRFESHFDVPRSKLEQRLTLSGAKLALDACRVAFDSVTTKMPEHLRMDVLVDGWLTTHDSE